MLFNIFIIFSIGILEVFLPLKAIAGSIVDKPHLCDRYAAHPSDIGKWTKGVSEEDLAPGPAIKHCIKAVKKLPNVARFHFQLGRALMRANRYDYAIPSLKRATKLGYAPAWAYLGDVVQYGLGVEVNKDVAMQYYRFAAEKGFEPAAEALAELDMQGKIPLNGYYFQNLISSIYQGDISSIPDNPETRSVVISIFQNYNKLCEQFEGMSPAGVRLQKALVNYKLPLFITKLDNFQRKVPGWLENYNHWQRKMDHSVNTNFNGNSLIDMLRGFNEGSAAISETFAMLVVEGVQDGKLFYSNHQCAGSEANQFIENISTLIISRQSKNPEPSDIGAYEKLRWR